MINSLTLFIGITLMYSTPLVFAALGGVVSERSGVTNLGIEGMMTIGAVTGATVGYYSGSAWAGFIAAGLAGGVPAPAGCLSHQAVPPGGAAPGAGRYVPGQFRMRSGAPVY